MGVSPEATTQGRELSQSAARPAAATVTRDCGPPGGRRLPVGSESSASRRPAPPRRGPLLGCRGLRRGDCEHSGLAGPRRVTWLGGSAAHACLATRSARARCPLKAAWSTAAACRDRGQRGASVSPGGGGRGLREVLEGKALTAEAVTSPATRGHRSPGRTSQQTSCSPPGTPDPQALSPGTGTSRAKASPSQPARPTPAPGAHSVQLPRGGRGLQFVCVSSRCPVSLRRATPGPEGSAGVWAARASAWPGLGVAAAQGVLGGRCSTLSPDRRTVATPHNQVPTKKPLCPPRQGAGGAPDEHGQEAKGTAAIKGRGRLKR